jgi:hypothetical protein
MTATERPKPTVACDIPEGYVVVRLDKDMESGFSSTRFENDLAGNLLYAPEDYRVIPRAWLEERDALYDRYIGELRELEARVRSAPRFRVTVTLDSES